MQTRFKIMIAVVAAATFGGSVYGVWRAAHGGTDPPSARKVAFYQDSMHPWIKSAHPGKCIVCGMDLTPIREADNGFGLDDGIVVLSSNSITVLHVQTEEVRPQVLTRTLRVAGTLEADEVRRAVVSAPGPGRVEGLIVERVGADVRKGEPLLTFFSPEWAQTRRYLQRAAAVNQPALSASLPPAAPSTGPGTPKAEPFSSDLLAPLSGTVTERAVSAGQFVGEGAPLFSIVDLSVLWFRFDAYEQQLPWLAVGEKVDVEVPAVPGKLFQAVIALIEPALDPGSRTVKVRAEIENPIAGEHGQPQRLLRLGMYAEGRVRLEFTDVLTVPKTAVLYGGTSAFAYVEKGDGSYERRAVRIGRQGDEQWEVLEGLEAGDRVVSSGNVLIDAQAQLGQAVSSPRLVGSRLTSHAAGGAGYRGP